MLLNEVGQR